MVRDFCKEFITNYTDLTILGDQGDGADALRECLDLKPDLVIVDIRLPEVDGLEILSVLKRKLPESKVLMFTATVNPHTVRVGVKGNADGFIEKAAGLEQLKNAIEAIREGKRYYSPHIKKLIDTYIAEPHV